MGCGDERTGGRAGRRRMSLGEDALHRFGSTRVQINSLVSCLLDEILCGRRQRRQERRRALGRLFFMFVSLLCLSW